MQVVDKTDIKKNIEDKADKLCIPLNSCVIIERKKNTKDEVSIGDKKIYIDTSWYEYDHMIQHGIVRYTPKFIHKNYNTEMELQKGDKVYCHHFVGNEANTIEIHGEKLNMLNYSMFYARVRNGKMHMLSDWVLLEIVKEDESEYKTKSGIWLKPEAEKLEQIGIIKYVNSKSKEQGFKPGDKVFFTKDADYEMEIEGEKLYRMRNHDILMRVDGKVNPTPIDYEHEQAPTATEEFGSFDKYNSIAK